MRKLNEDGVEILIGFWALLIIAVVVIGVFVAITIMWGILGLIGILVIIASAYYSSKTGWQPNTITIIMMLVGIVLVVISITDIGGLEFMQFANPLK